MLPETFLTTPSLYNDWLILPCAHLLLYAMKIHKISEQLLKFSLQNVATGSLKKV
jgi:hypothetical protein